MNRRTSQSPLLYTLGFLFCLILIFAVFFTGVRVGADKVEAKYEKSNANAQLEKSYTSYRQTDLVTFYHNVFSPYREFKRSWNEKVSLLAGGADNSSNILKSLRSLADDAYAQVNQASLFPDSPLLERGQLNILKSLRLFSEAANQASGISGGAQAAKTLRSGEFAEGAVKFGLLGQSNYYNSMLKWGSQTNSSIPSETGNPKVVSIGEWKKMPLLLKNATIAEILLNRGVFADYDPQDVTAKIDNLIHSGTAESLKLTSIQGATSLLISTDAFGERDFSKWRNQYYGNETLPELPSFYD